MIGNDINVVLPELVIVGFAMATLMWGVFAKREIGGRALWLVSLLFIGIGAWIALTGRGSDEAFGGMFINDAFGRFAKVTMLWSGAAVLLLSKPYLARAKLLKFEFPVLIALAMVGMMMMVSAGNMMALYMGLELQSLALYVIAAFNRDSLRSSEAGLKYFVLGAISSGVLLYGMSLVYGYTGALGFEAITDVIKAEGLPLGALFGLVFIVSGMAFKVSAAPFHMWTPDVYEGSPTPVTALFATAPKVAAAAMIARILHDAFGGVIADWQQILAFLALLSMYVGAIAAIGQSNIKRLMAYSSIGHMGFAMMGLAAGTEAGVQNMLIYMVVYVATNIGVFAFILNMEKDGRPVTDISALNMYSRVAPGRALALMLLMFSLAGIPPLAGFFAKLYVLQAAVDAGLGWLAIAAVIASVISAFYYLRIIYIMYFGEPTEALDGKMPMLHMGLLAASAAAMVFGIINTFGVEGYALTAARALLG